MRKSRLGPKASPDLSGYGGKGPLPRSGPFDSVRARVAPASSKKLGALGRLGLALVLICRQPERRNERDPRRSPHLSIKDYCIHHKCRCKLVHSNYVRLTIDIDPLLPMH